MNGEDYYKSNLTGPMVIVVGAEGKGLGRLVKEKCDIIVSLPMQGGCSRECFGGRCRFAVRGRTSAPGAGGRKV